MRKTILIIFTLLSFGCAEMTKQDLGTLTGGAVGGLVGSRFGGGEGKMIAIGAGALIGAYIGGQIGKTMDKQDRMQVGKTLENTKTGKARTWTNPDTQARYTVRPTRTYYRSNGEQPCREFTTTAIIGGTQEKVYGTACRQPDGGWKIVDQR